MSMLSKPSFGPRVALIYMTAGSMIEVWTGVTWYYFVRGREFETSWPHFLVTAFLLTGATLMILGLILGPLGQQARKAELPPPEAEKKEGQIQATAAATPNPVMPGAVPPAAGQMPYPGQPPMPPAGYAGAAMPVPPTMPARSV